MSNLLPSSTRSGVVNRVITLVAQGTPLSELMPNLEPGDLVELKGYYDAKSSVIMDELLNRHREQWKDVYPDRQAG